MAITLMTATISVEPGWAVGSVARADPAIDRDILLDAGGRPWIPGSSLAGSLRAHLSAATPPGADPPADVRLMGSRPTASRRESAASTVSPLWVLGAVFTPDQPSAGDDLETVGQTAIDRRRGAAAAGSLRFSRLAAHGGTLTAYLRHDPAQHPLTDADIQLIAAWQPAIGRDRTRGSGRARLIRLRYGTIDPSQPDGAATWLENDGPELFEAVTRYELSGPATSEPWLEAEFEITDGILVGTGLAERTATSRTRNGRPLVPGSAWKGLIRSRAEFIIRSCYGPDAACQQQVGCGDCPACAVFGYHGQRGMLAFRDSYIEDPGAETHRTQVGIDRVTGGSRDALLFTTAPVPSGRLVLRIDELSPVSPWVRNVIRHVLRDLGDGLIGIGSRTTRGLGTLRPAGPQPDPEPVLIPELEPPARQELAQ